MTAKGPAPLIRPARRSPSTFLPVLTWVPRYRLGDLRPDVAAGTALAALLVPEAMGYAGVAGVPPEVGLYAALAAVLVYVLVGGTSILVVGPASAVAAVSASVVGDVGGADPVALTAALALMSGLFLVVAGILRLGWIVNFISLPVLHAFVAALCLSILIGQVDGLVGTEVDAENAVGRAIDLVAGVGDWHPLSVALGVGALATILLFERFLPRIPGALVAVATGIVLVVVLDLGSRGVALAGDIPTGLPGVGLPDLPLQTWLELLAGSVALLLVGFSEGYAAASAVAARSGEQVDPDKELYSAGMANVAAGVVGGMAVSGSLSKSAASQAAGARTQVANLTAGLVVLATLLFLAPVFERLPEPVLAAVVIAAVLPATDPRRVLSLWHVNRLDFLAGLATYVLVLTWETLPALIVGVVVSLAFVVRRASFPDVVELRADAEGQFGRAEQGGLEPVPGVAVVRPEAPLIYANAGRLRQAVHTVVRERDDVRVVVLDAEMIADLDASGAEVLRGIDDELDDRDIELRLARAHHRVRAQMARSDLEERFTGRSYPTIRSAVALLPPGVS